MQDLNVTSEYFVAVNVKMSRKKKRKPLSLKTDSVPFTALPPRELWFPFCPPLPTPSARQDPLRHDLSRCIHR